MKESTLDARESAKESIVNQLIANLSRLNAEEANCDKVHKILETAFEKLRLYSQNVEYSYVDGRILKHVPSDYIYSASMALGRYFEKAIPNWQGDKETLKIVAITLASTFLRRYPDTFYWGQEILFSLNLVEEKLESNKLPPGNYSQITWYYLLPEEKRPASVRAHDAERANRSGCQLKADK